MDILDNLRQKVMDVTRTAVNASSDFLEITRLNLEVKSLEDRLRMAMFDMGRLYFSSYKEGKPAEERLNTMCAELVELENNIAEFKQTMTDLKNMKQCNSCKSEIDKVDAYCPNCGTKADEQIID